MRITALLMLLSFLFFTACSQEDALVTSDDEFSNDQEAIAKLIEDDEAVQSFEPNFNEEDVMSFYGKVAAEIFPVRVGQKMILTDRNYDVNIIGDSTFVSVTHTFEGILFIAASYDEFTPGDSNVVDTLLQKDFITQVKRNIIMVKIGNHERPILNWKVKSVSLPEGGTLSENIEIKKMTLTFNDGEVIEITEPTEYYFSRIPGFNNQIPVFGRNEDVIVNIELQSAYADTDFVSLTWGALRGMPHHRVKRKFDLVSSEFDGTYYQKTYQQTLKTHFIPGFRHAVINAIPKQVVFDDASEVELNSWGMPYAVR